MGDKEDQNSLPDDTALKCEISVPELWWVGLLAHGIRAARTLIGRF
jgi:hypothetical protein